jgi:hypothetical protein
MPVSIDVSADVFDRDAPGLVGILAPQHHPAHIDSITV